MNEEFAIQLKTILDNSSVERVKEQLVSVTKQYSKQNKVVIDVTSNVKQKTNPLRDYLDKLKGGSKGVDLSQDIEQTNEYSARIQILKDRMNELTEAIMWAQRVSGGLNLKPEEFNRFNDFNSRFNLDNPLKLQAELEEITEKYNKIIAKQNKVDEGTKKITKSHSSWLRSLRSLLLGVIGIRSAYSAVRKAMSAYLAQNDELQQKLNACWYALGSLLAPVLEWIVNLFVKIVSYVDALVKALGFAGINMSKYGKATGKAAKEQKQLAGFDEINNLNKQQDSGGAGIANPFNDVKIDPAFTGFIENFVKYLPTIVTGLLVIAGLLKALQLVKAGLLSSEMLPLIAGIGLAIFSVVLFVQDLLDYLKDPTWEKCGDLFRDIGLFLVGIGVAIGSLPVVVVGAVVAIFGIIMRYWEDIKSVFSSINDFIEKGIQDGTDFINGKTVFVGDLIGGVVQAIWEVIKGLFKGVGDLFDGLFLGVKQIVDGIIKLFQGDFKGGITSVLNGIANTVVGLFNGILSIVSGVINALIALINGAIKAINKIDFTVPDWVPFFGGKRFNPNISLVPNVSWSIPLLGMPKVSSTNRGGFVAMATGTNYVPNDMLAMVHQGEAVIPKKFNSQEYFGNNEETNRLLEQLIEVVDSKEFKTYISQNEIGKTAVKYINNQSRILGESII